MNKGYIIQSEKGKTRVLEIYLGKKGNEYYEFDLHPSQNINDYKLGEEVNFQYVMECLNHYPKYCNCRVTDIYAIIVKQLSFLETLKLNLKKIKQHLFNHENW